MWLSLDLKNFMVLCQRFTVNVYINSYYFLTQQTLLCHKGVWTMNCDQFSGLPKVYKNFIRIGQSVSSILVINTVRREFYINSAVIFDKSNYEDCIYFFLRCRVCGICPWKWTYETLDFLRKTLKECNEWMNDIQEKIASDHKNLGTFPRKIINLSATE